MLGTSEVSIEVGMVSNYYKPFTVVIIGQLHDAEECNIGPSLAGG